MFNIGPFEMLVLAGVALIVVGPDRLPGFARDAANMLRTLRDLATGARAQLKDELGPEFADMDLRNLNPRTAVQRAVFGDDVDLGRLNPRNALRDAIFGDEDVRAADPRSAVRDARDGFRADFSLDDDAPVSMSKGSDAPASGSVTKAVSRQDVSRPRPRPRPATRYDDAT